MKSAKQRVTNRSWRKRQVKLDINNIFEMSHRFDQRVQFCSYIGLGPSGRLCLRKQGWISDMGSMVPPLSQKVAIFYQFWSRSVLKSWLFFNFLANFTSWLF